MLRELPRQLCWLQRVLFTPGVARWEKKCARVDRAGGFAGWRYAAAVTISEQTQIISQYSGVSVEIEDLKIKARGSAFLPQNARMWRFEKCPANVWDIKNWCVFFIVNKAIILKCMKKFMLSYPIYPLSLSFYPSLFTHSVYKSKIKYSNKYYEKNIKVAISTFLFIN